MSLINEALKKAQKQRTGEAPPLASMPAIGGESPAHIARRAKPASFNTLLLRLGLGVVGLAVVAGGGVFLLRGRPPAEAPAEAKPAVVAPAVATAPAATSTLPAKSPPAPAARSSENVFVLPIAPPPAMAKAEPAKTAPATAARPEAPRTVAAAPQPENPAPEVAHAPLPPAKLEPRAIQYIENIKVAGIRASATDSKVLMNDRVYRVGNTVEHEMGLKLVEITASSLTFEDEHGGRYTRNF